MLQLLPTPPETIGRVLPPAYFRPAINPHNVRQIDYRPHGKRPNAAQKVGLRYEAEFHKFARAMSLGKYTTFEHHQLSFQDDTGWRACRPDGVLMVGGTLYIFEVKIRHTTDAWWQLHHLYKPVLQIVFPKLPIVCIEVCRSFDPMVDFPGTTRPIGMTDLPLREPPGVDTLIMVWKP